MKSAFRRRPAVLFDKFNPHWENYYRRKNALFVQSVQMHVNNLLRVRGYVILNDIYDLLGYERTVSGGALGWIRGSEDGDSYIDFGIWYEGFDKGRAWTRGEIDVMVLRFNVDRTNEPMPSRIKRLKEEGYS